MASPDPDFIPPTSSTSTAQYDPDFKPPDSTPQTQVTPQVSSDRANSVLDTAQKSGLPIGFVNKNYETTTKALAMGDVKDMAVSTPIAHGWFQDQENLDRGMDDRHNLAAHEATISAGEPPGIFKRAYRYVTEASPEELSAQAADNLTVAQMTGKEPQNITAEMRRQVATEAGVGTQPTKKEAFNFAVNMGMNAGLGYGGFEAAAAGKFLPYVWGAAKGIGAFAALNKIAPIDNFIPSDASDNTRTAMEMADLGVKMFASAGIAGAIKPVGDFLSGKLEERGIHLPGTDQQEIIKNSLSKLPKVKTGPTVEDTLNTLGNLTANNKLAKSSPDKFAEFIQRNADEYGKGQMTIPVDKFTDYLYSKGMNPSQEISKLGASLEGDTLSIPMGKLLAEYGNTEHLKGLTSSLQFKGEPPEPLEWPNRPAQLNPNAINATMVHHGDTAFDLNRPPTPEEAALGATEKPQTHPTIEQEKNMGPLGLAPEGVEQVNKAKESLKDQPFTKIVSGESARTRETASIVGGTGQESKGQISQDAIEQIFGQPRQLAEYGPSAETQANRGIPSGGPVGVSSPESISRIAEKVKAPLTPSDSFEATRKELFSEKENEGILQEGIKNLTEDELRVINRQRASEKLTDLASRATEEGPYNYKNYTPEQASWARGSMLREVVKMKHSDPTHNIDVPTQHLIHQLNDTANQHYVDPRLNPMDIGDKGSMEVKEYEPLLKAELEKASKDPDYKIFGKESWRDFQNRVDEGFKDHLDPTKPGDHVGFALSSDVIQLKRLQAENGGKQIFGEAIKRMADKEDLKAAGITSLRLNPYTGFMESSHEVHPEVQERSTINQQVRDNLDGKTTNPVDDITKTKDPIKTFLDISKARKKLSDFVNQSQSEQEQAEGIEKYRDHLEAANKRDKILAGQILGKLTGTPEDYKQIYLHNEYEKTLPGKDNPHFLTDAQKEMNEREVKPLERAVQERYNHIKDLDVPLDKSDYTPRMVADRGGPLERMRAGFKGVLPGNILRRAADSLKSKVMYALEDEDGNRKVVSIKGGEVTGWDNKIPTYLGPERQKPFPKISEFFDKQVMDKLDKVLYDLGIKHERIFQQFKKMGLGGNRVGVSFEDKDLIRTKFASPLQTILHEIGHTLDDRYDFQKEFIETPKDLRGQPLKLASADLERMRIEHAELKKLTDLRWEGQQTSGYFKSYVRKGEEKIASMFEAYIQVPEKFREIAPNLYEHFTKFLESKPELKPILDIKSSLVIGSKTIGGPQEPSTFIDQAGKKWDVKDALTSEIEDNTSLKYHKNAVVGNLKNYLELGRAERAADYLDNLKESKLFADMAVKIGTPEYDKLVQKGTDSGWSSSKLPQLRGYLFPNRIASAFDYYFDRGGPESLQKINTVLRNAIFFNPLIHTPNILVHWTVDRGLTQMLDPRSTMSTSLAKAWKATMTLDQNYLDVLDKGGNLLYADHKLGNFNEEMIKAAGMELQSNNGLLDKISKELGVLNPGKLVKAMYDFSSQVTWASNDIATLQRVFERQEHGMSLEDAIQETAKHIPNYRVPDQVFHSNALAKMMRGDSAGFLGPVTMFGAYHYGALKSYGEMLTDIKDGMRDQDPAKVGKSLDKIAALVVVTHFIYPMLDQVAQLVSGNPYASIRRAGASTYLHNTEQMIKTMASRQGATSVDKAHFIASMVAPSVLAKAGMEFWSGRDMYNGRQFSYGQELMNMVSPLDYASRIYQGKMTPGEFALSFAGIKTPKRRPR